MIQRKQSLFLFLAICCMAMCFMFPIATFDAMTPQRAAGSSELLSASAELNLIAKPTNTYAEILNSQHQDMEQFLNTWPLLVLTIAVAAISLLSIFLYKNRIRQMRIVAVAFLLAVADLFLIFIWAIDKFVDQSFVGCTDVDVHYGLGTWSVVAAIVFLFLAQRSIKKDEAKVRAADRLR